MKKEVVPIAASANSRENPEFRAMMKLNDNLGVMHRALWSLVIHMDKTPTEFVSDLRALVRDNIKFFPDRIDNDFLSVDDRRNVTDLSLDELVDHVFGIITREYAKVGKDITKAKFAPKLKELLRGAIKYEKDFRDSQLR
jgi:hypothetical protein